MTKLHSYLVKASFFSNTLGKRFKAGDIIKAPLSLGKQWTKQNLTIKIKENEQERNPGSPENS